MFCMVRTTWAIALPPRWPRPMPGWPRARRGLPFRWIGGRCVTCSSAAAVCCAGWMPCLRAPGQVGIALAILVGRQAHALADWRNLHHQGAQGFLHGVQGQQQLACPIPVVPFRCSRAGSGWTRAGPWRWSCRWARNAAHQPPGQHAAQQQGCGFRQGRATGAMRLLCFEIWAPAASIASRYGAPATTTKTRNGAAALGSKRSVVLPDARSVETKIPGPPSSVGSGLKVSLRLVIVCR